MWRGFRICEDKVKESGRVWMNVEGCGARWRDSEEVLSVWKYVKGCGRSG